MKGSTSDKAVTSHAPHLEICHHQVLLMTWRVKIVAPSGYTTHAKALLDSASSTSFITQRLAQHLSLRYTQNSLTISGIGGVKAHSAARGKVSFKITNSQGTCSVIPVEAIVMQRITINLHVPLQPILCDHGWNILMGCNWQTQILGSQGESTCSWEPMFLAKAYAMAGGMDLQGHQSQSAPNLDGSSLVEYGQNASLREFRHSMLQHYWGIIS